MGCLTPPSGTSQAHSHEGWHNDEPSKRKCLKDLRHTPVLLRVDYISTHMPRLCERLKAMHKMIQTETELQTDYYAVIRRLQIPRPEDFEETWRLRYIVSPSVDLFPMNIAEVVVGFLFRCRNKKPDASNYKALPRPNVTQDINKWIETMYSIVTEIRIFHKMDR